MPAPGGRGSGPGGCLVLVGSGPGEGWWSGPGGYLVETPPGTATAEGGTHPTGMHSYVVDIFSEK